MMRMLAVLLAVTLAASPIATSAPVQAEVFTLPVNGYCATDVKAFEPGLGKIVHGPTLMDENEGGFAIFTIEGTRVRAVGIALADGITWCIVWATLVGGEPS